MMCKRKKEKEKEKMRESAKKENGKARGEGSGLNREIALVTYVFIGLFAILIAYLARFLATDNSALLSNPYNKRQDLLAERVERGKILGSEGEVLAETKVNKKGVEVRSYPYDDLFCHVVGRLDKGKTGIEASYNVSLLTSSVNPASRLVNEFKGNKSQGNDVVTTLDVELQKTAHDALGGYKGAVVVMEPETGKLLAMVSGPSYNPNTINSEWENILEANGEDSELLNRASQGLYPPGSTFKTVTALAMLDEWEDALTDYYYDCVGAFHVGSMSIDCYNGSRHGGLDLTSAFAKSCNGAFADIGLTVGAEKMRGVCNKLLFNKSLPIPFEYKESSFAMEGGTDEKELAQTVIGQGRTLISPLHNAMITAAVANGGTLMKPYVVEGVVNHDGDEVWRAEPEEAAKLLGKKKAKALMGMMRQTVEVGTATALRSSAYEASGKTGTAEVGANKQTHAWFVGTAKRGGESVVVSVIVEEVGTGSEYAVPIAKRVLDAW